MKTVSVVRKTDPVGRLTLPKELRRNFNIEVGDSLEIFTDGDRIVLRKYQPTCVFCGENDGITRFKGKAICGACFKAMDSAES